MFSAPFLIHLSLRIFSPMYLLFIPIQLNFEPNVIKRKASGPIAYLPSIMTVACGLVPGEYLKVELSMTRSPWTPMTR